MTTDSPTPLAKQVDELVFELLDPLHELDASLRREILERATHVMLAPGEEVRLESHPYRAMFLLQGEVSRQLPGKSPELVGDGHPDVSKPLFEEHAPGAAKLVAREPSELILFDRRLCQYIKQEARRQSEEAQFQELGAFESALFEALTEAYRHGKIKIPSMPEVAQKIYRQLEKDPDNLDELSRMIGLEPALATKIVQTAGDQSGKISVDRAVRTLGVEAIRQMLVSYVLKGLCEVESSLIRERMLKVYRHSVHVAAYAYAVAGMVEGMDPDHALLCGLLHEIGAFPVLCAALDHLELISEPQELEAAVHNLKGMVGEMVLAHWGFDAEFIEMLGQVGDVRRDTGIPSPDYADVVIVAKLHSYIGTNRLQGMPQFSKVPAFCKVAGKEPGPRFSLKLMRNARARILEIEEVLEGFAA